jgi:hypothetical protein
MVIFAKIPRTKPVVAQQGRAGAAFEHQWKRALAQFKYTPTGADDGVGMLAVRPASRGIQRWLETPVGIKIPMPGQVHACKSLRFQKVTIAILKTAIGSDKSRLLCRRRDRLRKLPANVFAPCCDVTRQERETSNRLT